MHRKHLLPGFDDRTSDEAAINNLTQQITDVNYSTTNISQEKTQINNFHYRNFIVLSVIFNVFE